jgi:hypothetical protein
MVSSLITWRQTAVTNLRALGERPWTLLVFLLALNAVAYPYAGITHDGRLYAMMVLNRMENGSYNDDLFLRYGSQDSYSLFSPAVVPLASLVDLEWTFFLLYVLGNSLFLFALQRFLRVLLPDPLLSTLALIYLASTPIAYGGFGTFHVMEAFLTPRVLATSLVLLALEQLFRSRYILASFLLFVGCLMHPLMAFGAVLVLALFFAMRFLSPRILLVAALLGTGFVVVVLAYPPAGFRLFGQMDDDWLQVIYLLCPYVFPLQWPLLDWVQVLISQAIVTVAAVSLWQSDPRRGQFLAAVAVVGVGAVLGTVVGSAMGYKLLVQGQPYRFLWLVRLLQVPLTFQLAAQLHRRGDERHRLLAMVLLSTLAPSVYGLPDLLFFALCFGFLALVFRGSAVGSEAAQQKKMAWSSILGISMAIALLCGILFREIVVVRVLPAMLDKVDPWDCCRIGLVVLGPLVWLLISLVLLERVRRSFGLEIKTRLLLAVGFLTVQVLPFLLTRTSFYQWHWRPHGQDIQFVADFLNQQARQEKHPFHLYWSNGHFDVIWLQLRATSYFSQHHQLQSASFNRGTAMEGKRRAGVVGRFELAFLNQNHDFLDAHWLDNIRAFFPFDPDHASPTRADLAALCHEGLVDYAILPTDYDGLAAASNGQVYVYDCQRLRSVLPYP